MDAFLIDAVGGTSRTTQYGDRYYHGSGYYTVQLMDGSTRRFIDAVGDLDNWGHFQQEQVSTT